MAEVIRESSVNIEGTKRNPNDNSSVPCNFTLPMDNYGISASSLKSVIRDEKVSFQVLINNALIFGEEDLEKIKNQYTER